MMKKVRHILSVIGASILGTMGFSGCFGRAEYGCPTVDFKVDITVLDQDGNGIKGINVIPAQNDGTEILTTDESGNASWFYRQVGAAPKEYKVYFEDPDGERSGGAFARDSSVFVSTKTGEGDKHWYWGEWTVKGTKTLRKE